MTDKDLEHAIMYFKKYKVYGKLFDTMRKKYAGLGHLGGSFVLTELTSEEKSILSGFVGADLGQEKTIKILFSALNSALKRSRFGAFTWEEILAGYYGQPLLTKKQEHSHKKKEQEELYEKCLAECKTEEVREWITGLLLEHKHGYRIIEKQYNADREALRMMLHHLIHALEHLPVNGDRKQLLPVFAAEITGNPHYFDYGTTPFSLLINYGEYRFGRADVKLSGIEQRESVLYRMGILCDELSNSCFAYNVTGIKEDGCAHEGMQGFNREKQAFGLTLNTLGSVRRLEPAESGTRKVYVVENPAVFSYLTDQYPDGTFLCTAGQLKLACYVAMDMFPEAYTFFYSGDFDPEGLQIAQGLKKRYGKRLVLWNYTSELYERAVSDLALDETRLKKLDAIDVPELQDIRQCLLRYKRAAYQERMLDSYLCI